MSSTVAPSRRLVSSTWEVRRRASSAARSAAVLRTLNHCVSPSSAAASSVVVVTSSMRAEGMCGNAYSSAYRDIMSSMATMNNRRPSVTGGVQRRSRARLAAVCGIVFFLPLSSRRKKNTTIVAIALLLFYRIT
jgi:hypothetical protein